MTKSLFDYESAKSVEEFDGASMNVEPMEMVVKVPVVRMLEHKGVQCDRHGLTAVKPAKDDEE